MRNPIIHIYHHNDHDGIVSAAIAYRYYRSFQINKNRDFKFYMVDYVDEFDFHEVDFNRGDIVLLLDISLTKSSDNFHRFSQLISERVAERNSSKYNIIWIDHHVSSVSTAKEIPDNLLVKHINTSVSASALTWLVYNTDGFESNGKDLNAKFHNDRNVPKFLKYIDDYDCHKLMYEDTNNFHYGLNVSDPIDPKLLWMFYDGYDIDKYISIGREIQEYLAFDDKMYHVDMYGFEFALPEEHGGITCFCLNRKGNSIMFGDKYYEYDAVIPFYYVNGLWKYSIFTNKDDVNCRAIAESYGGGGHPKAAGFQMKEFIFK